MTEWGKSFSHRERNPSVAVLPAGPKSPEAILSRMSEHVWKMKRGFLQLRKTRVK